MTHFTDTRDPSIVTPPEWLKVGAQIGHLVNEWSERTDVVAFVGPGAGGPAPACFKPLIAEMEINVNATFTDGIEPEMVGDLTVRRTQFDWPHGSGAILHEAMHAKHSRWSFVTLNAYGERRPLPAKLATLFEESRIEARGVAQYPHNRAFLRACALNIVLRDFDPEEIAKGGWMGLSQLILLTLARVDAGVLDPDDVAVIQEKATELLGEELLGKLRAIWLEAHAHLNDFQIEPLLALGERWIELMKDADKDLEAEQQDAESALADMLGEMMEAMAEMAEDAEVAAGQEAQEQITKEVRAAEVAAKEAEKREENDHREDSEKLFGGKQSFAGRYGRTRSSLEHKRPPSDKERAAAASIGRMLEKAKYHDRIVTEHRSAVPPGKMRMQAVMQGHIERSRGAISTVEPFKNKRRHHAIDPDLTMGVLVDISGSMSSAMEPMGVTAWMMSDAARRIEARCAMVYYGNSVFPALRVGQKLDDVRIYSAPDSTEEFDPAFRALDGQLNLLHGSGARLLVIVSDMAYRDDVEPKALNWIERCSQSGVGVLILPYDNGAYVRPYRRVPGIQVINGALDPVATAGAIGTAAVKALEAASR
jgi:hypothetical protein